MITLVDTSAWVEYLHDTGSAASRRLEKLITAEAALAVTDIIYTELLAGARSDYHAVVLERLLNRATHFPVRPIFDYEAAASIYRVCRRAGFTPRHMTGCLIAAVALHQGAVVLHNDSDFDGMARHVGLLVDEVG